MAPTFFLWNKEVLDKGACLPAIIIRNMSCTAITEGSEKTRYTHYYGKDFFFTDLFYIYCYCKCIFLSVEPTLLRRKIIICMLCILMNNKDFISFDLTDTVVLHDQPIMILFAPKFILFIQYPHPTFHIH